jgi:CO/xanthine dehydrogenase FAD-binding subunit
VLRPFELHRPTTIDEATGLLDELGDDAVVYSGGTELLLVMKLGFADYPHLIDVKLSNGETGQLRQLVHAALVEP